MPTLPLPPEPLRAPRWRLLSALLSLVLLAHLMLLQGMSFGEPPRGRASAGQPLQARQIERPVAGAVPAPDVPVAATAPAAAPAAAAAPVPAPTAAPPAAPLPAPGPPPARPSHPLAVLASAPTPTPAVKPLDRLQVAAPMSAADADADAEPESEPEPDEVAALPPPLRLAAAPAAPRAPAGGGEVSVPVYPTRLPPPALLRYELKRGAIGGTGELVWRPAEGRYRMTMEGTVFGLNALGWVSEGRIDAHGIAPERFVDRRRGRDARAANFQRDKGLITYSSVSTERALVPGAQDRLSFMLQLSAIIEAAPARYGVGKHIALFVVGARGEADVWTFTVASAEPLDLPVGRVSGALHLRREPRKPYDTRAELWLDPARSHLPVRVRLGSAESNEATEFLLREVATP